MKVLRIISPFYITITFLLGSSLYAQECFWASSAGGYSYDNSHTMTHDRDYNVYIGGITEGTCFFNVDTIEEGIFIAKFNQTGSELWIKSVRDYYLNHGYIGQIIFDSIQGNLLATGAFNDYLILPDTIIYGSGLTIFVFRMDLDGNIIWIKTAGGQGSDFANSITIDPDDNIYISGSNEDSASFEYITIPHGGYLAKFDPDGNIIWAKSKFRFQYITFSEVNPSDIVYSNSHLIVNGDILNDTIIIDSLTIIHSLNPVTGHYTSSYISSFDENGNLQWLTEAGGPGGYSGSQLSIDNSNNILITGVFYNKGTFGTDTLHSSGPRDCFIAKYDPYGNYLWAIQTNFSLSGHGWGISAVPDGSVYISGQFSGTGQFGNVQLNSVSFDDIFMAHYGSNGNCIGARQYGKGWPTFNMTDRLGNIYFTGHFDDTLDIAGNTFISRGSSDIFTAKCSPITGYEDKQSSSINELFIYANPNTGQCNITIPDDFKNEAELFLKVSDMQGKVVMKGTINMSQGTISLDLHAQARGTYVAELSNKKKAYTGKIVFK